MKRDAFLQHVAWTGLAGTVYALTPGGPVAASPGRGPSFVQISDSHIGFKGAVNGDVAGTLRRTVAAINAMPQQPRFVIHTGDVTHLSKLQEFDDARAVLGELRAPLVAIPGEHDVIGAEGLSRFSAAFGRNDAAAGGWYAWDQDGTHFVAIVNVYDGEANGRLGAAQLAWLKNDLAARSADTPLVVFVHAPLYALYPAWGWTTDDGVAALALFKRFASATVLSGHIHQIVEHREDGIRFATARATAFPQPEAGTAEKPGPKAVPPGTLLSTLGYRTVAFDGARPAWTDIPLG